MCTNFMIPADAEHQYVVTGRTMDFGQAMDTILCMVPRGKSFPVLPPANGYHWQNSYGFVAMTVMLDVEHLEFDAPYYSDGLNEEGLSAASLWLPGTAYPEPSTSIQNVYVADMCALILGMAAIRMLGLRGPWRNVFLALGTAVVIRYFYWRTTSTLPPVTDTLNFICGATLWVAEIYSAVMLAISLFVIADPLERKPAQRLSVDDMPTVDVFVPTYNEDRDLLAITLAAATSIDYPPEKLKVHLLDDGGTDQK